MKDGESQTPFWAENQKYEQNIDGDPETIYKMRLIVNEKQGRSAAKCADNIEYNGRDEVAFCFPDV
ncbi:hypothetical protein D3C80_1808200 [compost metagenome]